MVESGRRCNAAPVVGLKTMRILGAHTMGHDTCVCLFQDGVLEFACESERVSRIRHDMDVRGCLQHLFEATRLRPSDIDALVFDTPVASAVADIEDVETVVPSAHRDALVAHGWSRMLGRRMPCAVVAHEAAHAALAAHFAGWRDDCLIFVNEGWGGFSQNSTFRYSSGAFELLAANALPWFGTGFGWSAISYLLGIGDTPSSPGRTMALGGYGRWSDAAAELIATSPVRFAPETGGWIVCGADEIVSFLSAHPSFDCRADFVATFQRLFTDVVVDYCRRAVAKSDCSMLSLSGGCALNLPANTALRAAFYGDIPIPPNCNDSGQAIGAVLFYLQTQLGVTPCPFGVYRCGITLDAAIAVDRCRMAGFELRPFDGDAVASSIADGMVVALAQGCSELGPRALGHRSLLASAHAPGMRRRVSEQLKGREWYRPLGGVITVEAFASLLAGQRPSPYMLFNYELPASCGPEARHVDGTSRLQTVGADANPRLWAILTAYADRTGHGVVINTSLNAKGKPIAYRSTDVLEDFMDSDVDVFVFDDVTALRPRR